MITRAIIEEVVDKYKYRIRIPSINKAELSPLATSFDNLYIASVATMPNCIPNYNVGDAVIIGFENNTEFMPVILGQLSRDNSTDSNLSINCDTITSKVDAYLPQYTFIGNVTPSDINNLSGTKENLQYQIEILQERVAKLEELLENKG